MDIHTEVGLIATADSHSQTVYIAKKEPEENSMSCIPCSSIDKASREPDSIPKDVLRRRLAAERERRRRAMIEANETPEERAVRRAKATEKEKIMRLQRKERVAARAAAAEARKNAMEERKRQRELLKELKKIKSENNIDYNKEYRKAKRQNETPEQKAMRAAKEAEAYKRKCMKKMLMKIEANSGGEQGLLAAQRLAEDRQKKRERDRQNRILREARMTEEQKEARRIKMNEKDRLKRERLKMEMPEKATAIRARINARRKLKRELEKPVKIRKTANKKEYNKEYRQKIRMNETPEEKEARLAKDREAVKVNRIKRREARLLKRKQKLEAPKQNRRRPRTVKTAEEKREQRRKNNAARYARLTPEQREEERIKRVEWIRRYRDKLRQTLTPEQKQIIVKKDTERTRLYRQRRKEMLNLEQHKEKLAACIDSLSPEDRDDFNLKREQMVEIKQQKLKEYLSKLTPEERVARNILYSKIDPQRLQEIKRDSLHEDQLSTDIKIENEVLQETYLSGFGSSKGVPGNNFSAIGNGSRISRCVEEAFDCMRQLIGKKAMQDQYSLYGDHIGNQIRSSGRNDKEIYIAKQLINDVIEQLSLDNSLFKS